MLSQLHLLVLWSCPFVIVAGTRPNIVVVLTDDQDSLLHSMHSMVNTMQIIGSRGVIFKNAYVNTPICCPSRSSILTGKYLHNTYVRNNSVSGNCSSLSWQQNFEHSTIASILKSRANYVTFYAGKYLNQYGCIECGGTKHVPAGYDWWIGLSGNSKYYNYTLSINGTAFNFTDTYLTDLIKTNALEFLNQKFVEEKPFFMMLSTPAPHAPFTAAPRHKREFPKARALRTPSFNYSSSDKHWLVGMPPKYFPSNVTILDDIQKHRLQTLLAVDELVTEVVTKLNDIKVLSHTYVIFTSDNGFHIGQFVQPWDKRQPYETDIKVPLLVRGPNVKENYVSDLPVSAVDLAPSILDMANIELADLNMDGQSFLKSIQNNSTEGENVERSILIEYFGEGNWKMIDKNCPWIYDGNVTECSEESWCKCQDSRNNTYVCIRHISKAVDVKFCKFEDDENFVEAYDLKADPFELHNIYHRSSFNWSAYDGTLEKLRSCSGSNCLM